MMPIYEDVIGQLPILSTYNHGTLGFKVDDDTRRPMVIIALQAATGKLTEVFPWLSGAVINEGSGPGNSGIFKLIDWPVTASSPNPVLHVRDHTDTLPSFAELMKKKAPCGLIDGKLVAPYPGFPESYKGTIDNPAPILAIQANFVKGGLLLNFSTQHNAIDATGMMQIIKLFSLAMQGVNFTDSAIMEGNRDRTRVIPLMAPGDPIKDHTHLRRPIDFSPPPPPVPDQIPRWAYFLMDGSAVPMIKFKAETDDGYEPSVPFISSNDALSAFYWKCLADVHVLHGKSRNTTSKFLRAIDARKAMGVSPEYMGHMVYHASTQMTFGLLQKSDLGTIACQLRNDLNAVNNAFSVRSYATYIANTPDKSHIMYGGLFNGYTDVGASSVANDDFFHSFGLLGKPEFARRPNLAPIPGCIFFMPIEGDKLPILVCLRDEDMNGLKKHPLWNMYTEFIG